jgi:hypothetical protein
VRGNTGNNAHRFRPKFKEYLLKTNGFGRWKQSIVVRVPGANADLVGRSLFTHYQPDPRDASFALIIWNRFSVRQGDDEDVVNALWVALGRLAPSVQWEIDWEASSY